MADRTEGWGALRLAIGWLASAMALAITAPRLTGASDCGETGFLNRSVTVGGDTCRYQVFVPADYTNSRAWPVILFLHGSGERGRDGLLQTEIGLGTALRRHADRYPAIVVFPQAPPESRWAGDRADIAIAALDQTELEFKTDPDRVYLTGLSMGGSGAWHLAYRHPARFAAILAICGLILPIESVPVPLVPPEDGPPFEALAGRLRRVPIWIFHGDADTVVPVEQSRRMATALGAVGAPCKYSELAGVGHNAWDPAYQSPEVAAWLLAQRRPSD